MPSPSRLKPPSKMPVVADQGGNVIHNPRQGRFFWSTYDIDSTLPQDRAEGKWHEPQVIINDVFPHSLWSHRIDAARQAQYVLRQLYAFPSTIIGCLRLFALPFVGMFIRYTIQALWGYIGWYAAIPGGILILALVISMLMVNYRADMLFPSFFKMTLICMGTAL